MPPGTSRNSTSPPRPLLLLCRPAALCHLGGNYVASVSADRYLRIWDMGQVKLVAGARYAHNTPLQCVDYSPETGMLATCGQVGRRRAMLSVLSIW